MAETQTLDARVAALGSADDAPRRSLWRRIEPTAWGVASFVVLLLVWQIVPYFVPLKPGTRLFFTVPSIAAARSVAAALGGEVFTEQWKGPGFTVCNAMDPEGNIFQVREAAP